MKLSNALVTLIVVILANPAMLSVTAEANELSDSATSPAAKLQVAQGNTQGSSANPLQGRLEDGTAQGGTETNNNLTKQSGKTGAKKPLQGQIHAVGAVLPAFKLHMTDTQLKAAVAQYAADLRQFYAHLQDYNAASAAHKKLAGECTENAQQWQLKLAKDKLTLNQVIIPVGVTNAPPPPPTPPEVPPPRICCVNCLITGRCGHLGTGGGGGSNPGAARADSMREQQARADLGKAQGDLRFAETENGYTHSKAIDEAKIEQSQQNLAEKFGQLKGEYDMLKIEKSALTGIQPK